MAFHCGAARLLVRAAVCAIAIAAPVRVVTGGAESLRFYWAVQLATGGSAAPQYVVVTNDVLEVKTGDTVQFYLSPTVETYAYLLHDGPEGLARLYPVAPSGAAPISPGAQQYFPSKLKGFTVDGPPARERIYLLASTTRLVDLEAVLAAHERAGASDRARAAAAVITEISRLRRVHIQPHVAAPRPVMIAGSRRGSPSDLAADATEVKAGAFYARTYFVEHR